MFLKKVTLLKEKIQTFNLYPFSIPAIKSLDEIKIDRNVTFL